MGDTDTRNLRTVSTEKKRDTSPPKPESTTKGKIRDFRVSNFDIAPVQMQVGNGLAVVTTGIAGRMYIPCGVTIYEWTILADASGSITFDLWVDSHANAPPAVGDTICGSAHPLLSSAQSGQSRVLTGWTTLIKAGSWLIVNVDSCSTIKQATICLSCRKGA